MTQEDLTVRFVKHHDSLRGENHSFKKIAFISKFYQGPLPLEGEQWICKIVFDTKPMESNRGVFFLRPISPVGSITTWNITEDASGIEICSTTMFAGRQIDFKRALFTPGRLIKGCPKSILLRAEDLWESRKRRLDEQFEEEKRLRRQKQAEQIEKLNEVEARKQQLMGELTNGLAITVSSILCLQHEVTLRPKNDYYRNHDVLIGGELAGLYDSFMLPSRESFPLLVEERQITFSNGQSVSIFNMDLQVIKSWSKRGANWSPKKEVIFKTKLAVTLGTKEFITWQEAEKLSVGDEISKEYPFQALGDWLSNGLVWFPRERPQKQEWKQLPIPAVPKEFWEPFLSGLEGKFLQDLLSYHKEVTTKKRSKRVDLTERQRCVRALIKGQMWNGSSTCKRLSIGKNVIFEVTRESKRVLYVVDNPGVGAIFVFNQKNDAVELANGNVSRSEAKKRGQKRVVHSVGWESRLKLLLCS
ncbi:MAG: hypothetical protein K2X77_33630 [Candidatus Obscuribacterales bacterium]|jgi:hypothetical protein|nr:hypothetical protein [Candidatus Obscuribacterales bacterium]